jgi:gamma-glutamyltranspeptidase / glutathione hydrolase
MAPAKRFPNGCVASPHHLASEAGLAMLAAGGNALDAALAVNLTLAVVTPYLCGFGGDLFAIIWRDGLHSYDGSGRAPAGATREAVRSAAGSDLMPLFGPLSVTVPGAVEAWFALIERFGSRSFSEIVVHARRHAEQGFVLSERGATYIGRSAVVYADEAAWRAVYGSAAAGEPLRQTGLVRTIDVLAKEGPDAYYRGEIGAAIAQTLSARGSTMTPDDMAAHTGEWVEPLSATYRGCEIVEMPPPTQGVTALEALKIAEAVGAAKAEGPEREHLLIEAMKLALADRDAFVSDPAAMTIDARDLLEGDRIARHAAQIDPSTAGSPPPGAAAIGGTAYMCAADSDGMCVSLIQSNYVGFGSGVHVPGWGINLQNRGGYFSLDPAHVNVIAPRKRTMHTLIPAMALRDGKPWLVFGTMGGDGQAQTHLQVLTRMIDDGTDPQEAINAPRWVVTPSDWSVAVEAPLGAGTIADLGRKGHAIRVVEPLDTVMGHAHAIRIETDGGYAAASDPRSEGAALGL